MYFWPLMGKCKDNFSVCEIVTVYISGIIEFNTLRNQINHGVLTCKVSQEVKHDSNLCCFNCVYLFLWLLATKQERKYLGDQSGIAHGRGQADSQPLEVAIDYVGLGDKAESTQVAETYSSQYDVAELTTGWLDHRSVPESTDQSN